MKILAFQYASGCRGAEAIVDESRGVDVVVGAGDFASCGLGHEDTLDVLRRIAVPFVLVPGNHDGSRRVTRRLRGLATGPSASRPVGCDRRCDVLRNWPRQRRVIDPEPWNKVLDEAEAAQMLARVPRRRCWFRIRRRTALRRSAKGRAARRQCGASRCHRSAPAQHHDLPGHVHNAWGQSGTIGQTAMPNIGPKPRSFVV